MIQPALKAPRQPWHDLHCRIEGNAAYDVLINFEQRWRKATRWKEFSLFFKGKTYWHDDALIKIERISWILSPSPAEPDGHGITSASSKENVDRVTIIPEDNPMLHVMKEENPENWHVQV